MYWERWRRSLVLNEVDSVCWYFGHVWRRVLLINFLGGWHGSLKKHSFRYNFESSIITSFWDTFWWAVCCSVISWTLIGAEFMSVNILWVHLLPLQRHFKGSFCLTRTYKLFLYNIWGLPLFVSNTLICGSKKLHYHTESLQIELRVNFGLETYNFVFFLLLLTPTRTACYWLPFLGHPV